MKTIEIEASFMCPYCDHEYYRTLKVEQFTLNIRTDVYEYRCPRCEKFGEPCNLEEEVDDYLIRQNS